MFNLDPGKLLVIAVVAIILLGPDKLPQVARQAGNAWRSFNEFRHRMESEVRNTIPDLPPTSEIARLARSPSALLNHLSAMSSDDEQGSESASPPTGGTDEVPDGSFQPPGLDGRSAAAAPGPSEAVPPSPPPTAAPPPAPRPAHPTEAIAPGDPTLN